jgi:hypothetical protein
MSISCAAWFAQTYRIINPGYVSQGLEIYIVLTKRAFGLVNKPPGGLPGGEARRSRQGQRKAQGNETMEQARFLPVSNLHPCRKAQSGSLW